MRIHKNNIVRRVSGFPKEETAIWTQIAVVIKGPYEDHIHLTNFGNKPLISVSLVVDLLIGQKIYKKIPVAHLEKV